MTTRRRPSSSKKRTSARSSTGRARTTRSRTRTTSTPRRRQSRPATTLGAAVGTVAVAFILGAPWSVRIALIVLVLVGAVGYLVWSRRQ